MAPGAREEAASEEETRRMVQQYYGETLKGTQDLKTSACCVAGAQAK